MSDKQPMTAPRIDPAAIYSDADVRVMLGLTSSATARARREGRLRFSRQGKRILHRGIWVLDWLERDSAAARGKGGGA